MNSVRLIPMHVRRLLMIIVLLQLFMHCREFAACISLLHDIFEIAMLGWFGYIEFGSGLRGRFYGVLWCGFGGLRLGCRIALGLCWFVCRWLSLFELLP